jgi:hypothetical protein
MNGNYPNRSRQKKLQPWAAYPFIPLLSLHAHLIRATA